MKNIKKIMLSVIAAFLLLAIIRTPAQASTSSYGKFWQSNCTTNSITVSWTKPALSTGYTLTQYVIKDADGDVLAYPSLSDTSKTLTLTDGDGYTGTLYLYYYYTSPYGSTYYNYYYAYVNSLPKAASKSNFSVTSVLVYTKKALVTIAKPSCFGAELRVYKGSKCVYTQMLNSSSTKVTSSYFPISKNSIYKYRVRYFYKNYDPALSSNGKYYYGAWSKYRSFDFASMSGKAKSSKKGFSLTVKKVSGVSKYLVYIKTSSKGSYKKVKTINIGSKKSYTVQIKSGYKKKAYNYIKVVPYIKGYGNSDVSSTGTIKVYK